MPSPAPFSHHVLSHGLNVVAAPDPLAHTAAVGFFVKTGSRDEPTPLMGVSHFLEHMMFKGTARRSAEDVNREFDEIGANYNAFTSQENTVYYAQVLPEFTARAVDLLADMMRPALREDDFNMEKNVILEEIGMYQDRPQWRLQDTILETFCAGHPLGHRVLGTQESVGSLRVDQMRSYFEKRYSPDNIVFAAAGKIDLPALLQSLTALTRSWQPSGSTRQYDPLTPKVQSCAMADPKLSRHYLAVMLPGPSAQDPQRFAARILADILGDAEGSRLYWALADPGLADEADLSHFEQDRFGCYLGFASCDPDRGAQVEFLFLDTLANAAGTLTADEVERARNKIATDLTLNGESPLGHMRNLGSHWIYLQQYLSLEEELEKLLAVRLEDVQSLAAQLRSAPRTIARLGPR
ncbi:MAG: insulinase family protein [Phycisphaeraceae bacterium]|nr:insulinase family protein [Phycisphaeraceae bacterium]